MSRSVLLTVLAVSTLAGIAVARVEVSAPGVMLLAVLPITALGVMYGVRGGLAGALVASGVFLGWALTNGHPGVVDEVDEPAVFFIVGLLAGVDVHGSARHLSPRQAVAQAELRQAIQRGEVVFDYQPLAEASTRRVVGFEALARWEHPLRGRLGPGEFIPLAERDERTIWELTALALDRVLFDMASWGEAANGVRVAVNLSSLSLGRRDLATQVSRMLDKHGLPASRLAVEITETSLDGLPPAAADALDGLKQLGVAIALDDFGTGYSSITRLGRLPFDTLKVDLHLIGLPPAADANRILRAMIDLAQALGLRVVAERVEDDATWDEVSRMGCDLVQGFRLSRPLPAAQVRDWLVKAGSAPDLRPAPAQAVAPAPAPV